MYFGVWGRLVNKLEPGHIVFTLQQMTKPSNLHLIGRLQFPWLTAFFTENKGGNIS